jgi:hypothetical protein
MTNTTTIITVFAGIVAAISLAIYFFGIPPAWKRAMEEKALKTMGENKASYLVKGQSCNVQGDYKMVAYCLYRPNLQDASLRPRRRQES